MMRLAELVELHILGRRLVIDRKSHSRRLQGVDVECEYPEGIVREVDQRVVGRQAGRG
jgi:hypothetical protein